MKFCGKTSGGIAKFRLFSQQATHVHTHVPNVYLMKFDFGATNGLTGELRLQGKKWHTLGLAHEKTGPLHVSAQ